MIRIGRNSTHTWCTIRDPAITSSMPQYHIALVSAMLHMLSHARIFSHIFGGTAGMGESLLNICVSTIICSVSYQMGLAQDF